MRRKKTEELCGATDPIGAPDPIGTPDPIGMIKTTDPTGTATADTAGRAGAIAAAVKDTEAFRAAYLRGTLEILRDGQAVLCRRMRRLAEEEDVLDAVIARLAEDGDLPAAERREAVKRLLSLKVEDLGRIASVLSSCLEKQTALCRGEGVACRKFEDF